MCVCDFHFGGECHQLNLECTGISSFYNSEGATKDFQKIKMSLIARLVGAGMAQLLPRIERTGPPEVLHVHVDGCIVGSIASAKIEEVVNHLRSLKLLPHSGVCSLVLLLFFLDSLFFLKFYLISVLLILFRFQRIWKWVMYP